MVQLEAVLKRQFEFCGIPVLKVKQVDSQANRVFAKRVGPQLPRLRRSSQIIILDINNLFAFIKIIWTL